MKILLLIICISTIGYGQDADSLIQNQGVPFFDRVFVTHYSGYFGKLSMSGHEVEDSLGNKISNSKFCQLEGNPQIWFYQLTEYYLNGEIKYDSILDFRDHKRIKMQVSAYSANGSKLRVLRLKSKIEFGSAEGIKKDSVFWNGFEKVFYPAKTKTKFREVNI
ncbi:MAG: hypothetical protein GQ574_09750 [Crocinitomix sp.]|nr:hypothetical protein [Crocinitomix sp.]